MDTKLLNNANLTGDFVLIDNEEHELWRKRLSATDAFVENMHVDNLSYSKLIQDKVSIENISVSTLSAGYIFGNSGKFRKIEASAVNSVSASGSVSSELKLNPIRISLFSGSGISEGDGIPGTYGAFSASVVSDDALIIVSKQTSDKERFALSVQPTGFTVFNENRQEDEETSESSYVELEFPIDLSGRHTIATRQDIESRLSNYMEKTDIGNLDLNHISCQDILVSAAAAAEGGNTYFRPNVALKTPRSSVEIMAACSSENGINNSDSEIFLSCVGNNGAGGILCCFNGRYYKLDSENPGISGNIGVSYILAQTRDVRISSDSSYMSKTKRTKINLISDEGNPSISIDDSSNRSLKVEIPFSDRSGSQIMALRSDLSDYSYNKEDIARIFKDKADLSDMQATIFDFGRNDISSFSWIGRISSDTLIGIGLKKSTGWNKQPLYVKIGNRISAIGDYTFAACESLRDIDLGGVRHIGQNAFNRCSNIMDLRIPDTVSAVGNDAFNGCAGLKALTLPPSIQDVGQNAFSNTGLTEITVEGKHSGSAESLLNGKIPSGCQIKTWDFQPKGEYVQQSSLTGFATDDAGQNYKIAVNPDGAAYVHVPWSGPGEIPPRYKTYDDTLSSLSNSGYATRKWVQEQGYSTGQQSLDDYATKNWVSAYHQNNPPSRARITITQDNKTKGWFTLNQSTDQIIKLDGGGGSGGVPPEEYKTYDDTLSSLSNNGYATQTWVNGKGYATESWVNGKGYLTSHQSLAGYATQQWVTDKGYSKVQVQQDYSDAQARTQIATITVNGSPTALYAPTAGASIQPGNGRITVTQGGTEVTSFTVNQSNNLTVALADGGNIDQLSNYLPLSGGAISGNLSVVNYSFIGGNGSSASNKSFAFGNHVRASGSYSHAEGSYTSAVGNYAHAEGNYTYVTGQGLAAHAEGYHTSATTNYSHAAGYYAQAKDQRSWCWQGKSTTTPYESKGQGTFCINPQNGINDFYIGTDNLKQIIDNNSTQVSYDQASTNLTINNTSYALSNDFKLASYSYDAMFDYDASFEINLSDSLTANVDYHFVTSKRPMYDTIGVGAMSTGFGSYIWVYNEVLYQITPVFPDKSIEVTVKFEIYPATPATQTYGLRLICNGINAGKTFMPKNMISMAQSSTQCPTSEIVHLGRFPSFNSIKELVRPEYKESLVQFAAGSSVKTFNHAKLYFYVKFVD